MSKLVSKTSPLVFIVSPSDADAKGERADRVLTRISALPSRSQLKIWFSEGLITLGGKPLQPASKLKPGDQIEVLIRPEPIQNLEPIPLDLKILFEDDDLLVLHKPKGLSMHPGAGKEQTTLVHGLLHHSQSLSSRSGDFRPGIVHRLDKDTEGLVVVAKSNEIHDALSEQFSKRLIIRRYWALVYGHSPKSFIVEGNIGRSPVDRKKMAVVKSGGKSARTEVKTLKHFAAGYSWIECQLKTGRTHQIRVHLSSKGYSLLGDPLYARKGQKALEPRWKSALDELNGQALVAFELGFVHPRTNRSLHFEIPPPSWMLPFIHS